MALKDLYAAPTLPASMANMSPTRLGALAQMAEVPGMMDMIANMRAGRSRSVGGWDPTEVMNTLNPNRYVRYDPTLGQQKGGVSEWGNLSYLVRNNPEAYAEAVKRRDENELYKQLQEYADLGVNFTTKGMTAPSNMETMADRLYRYGIDSMQDVGVATDASGKQVVYNRNTGQALPNRIGKTTKGHGQQNYYLSATPEGYVVPSTGWKDTSDNKQIAQALSIAALVAAPWALPTLGAATGLGAMGAGALYGAGTGAITAGIGGGDPLKAALVGGVTGAIGGSIGSGMKIPGTNTVLPQTNLGASLLGSGSSQLAQNAANALIRGGLSGAIGTAAYGGNALKGGALGALSSLGGALGGAAGASTGGELGGIAGGMLGGQTASRLGQQLFGSTYNRTPNAVTNSATPAATQQPVNLAQFPVAAQQRIAGVLQAQNRPYTG